MPVDAHHRTAFPHNVTFRTTDWITEDTAGDEPTYDVVIAYDHTSFSPIPATDAPFSSFSITKWIHLHHGDQGISSFFQRAHRVLKPGGTLLVEPQAWETYGKARRMDAKLRENAKHLRLRPQDFPALLGQLGFGPPEHLGTTGEGGVFGLELRLVCRADNL